MENHLFHKCARAVEQYRLENPMRQVFGWQQSTSDPKIALVKTDEGIVPVKSFGGGFISVIQPWANNYKQLCSEYNPDTIEWQPDAYEKIEKQTPAQEAIPQAAPEPVPQTPVVEPAVIPPIAPQMPMPPESLPPAFVNWENINRKRKGILPSFLNLSGIFFFYAALRLFFNDETTIIGIIAIPLAILAWLVLGGIASLIRSLRTIETYTANVYEQMKHHNRH